MISFQFSDVVMADIEFFQISEVSELVFLQLFQLIPMQIQNFQFSKRLEFFFTYYTGIVGMTCKLGTLEVSKFH